MIKHNSWELLVVLDSGSKAPWNTWPPTGILEKFTDCRPLELATGMLRGSLLLNGAVE